MFMSMNLKCRQIYAGLIIFLAFLFFALTVHAGNVTLSWTQPPALSLPHSNANADKILALSIPKVSSLLLKGVSNASLSLAKIFTNILHTSTLLTLSKTLIERKRYPRSSSLRALKRTLRLRALFHQRLRNMRLNTVRNHLVMRLYL